MVLLKMVRARLSNVHVYCPFCSIQYKRCGVKSAHSIICVSAILVLNPLSIKSFTNCLRVYFHSISAISCISSIKLMRFNSSAKNVVTYWWQRLSNTPVCSVIRLFPQLKHLFRLFLLRPSRLFHLRLSFQLRLLIPLHPEIILCCLTIANQSYTSPFPDRSVIG